MSGRSPDNVPDSIRMLRKCVESMRGGVGVQ